MTEVKKGVNVKALIGAVIIGVIAAGVYFMTVGKDPRKKAGIDAVAYIEAVQKRDFDAVFRYNAATQRRSAIILQRAEGDKDRELKELFDESKASFDQAAFVSDIRAQWIEKFLFAPGSTYTITNIELVEDRENPSQPSSERVNALIDIEVVYNDKESAPDLNGKAKGASYQMMMIQAKNVSRVLRGGEIKDKRWLFLSISVKPGSVRYWQA